MRHRDFRRFIFGQIVSLSGTWMQTLAVSWLVYRLTRSTVLMGVIGFCNYVPVLLLGPLAGVAADRFSRGRIVLTTQLAFAVQAGVLAVLTLTGWIQVWHLAVLSVLWGAINAFDIPGRQSLYVQLVGKEDLSNAIALNSMTFNAARVVGPPIGGFCVYAFGEGLCFVINAVSYLGVIVSLITMRRLEPARTTGENAVRRLVEGFRYAWTHPTVRRTLAITAFVNLSTAPAVLLGPVFADSLFHQGSKGLGMLSGALGIGAVVGTLALARERESSRMKKVILWSALGLGCGLLVYSASRSFGIALLAMFLSGFSIFRLLAGANTLVQNSILDEYRGRVMALYSMMAVGILPLGQLAAGTVAQAIGARSAVAAGGLLCLTAAVVWLVGMRQEN
jgi:predicted MFS family arabinose efflux permease